MINWDSVLTGMQEEPNNEVLKVLFYKQVQFIRELQHDIAVYDREPEYSPNKTYTYLLNCVRRIIDKKREAYHQKAITQALAQGVSSNSVPVGPRLSG